MNTIKTKNMRGMRKRSSKAVAMVATVAAISLLLSGCGGGDDITFEYKVQEKYSGQFNSEEAARLLDYVTIATEVVNEGYDTLEITEAEEALVNSETIDYFTKSDGTTSTEVAKTMLNLKINVATTKWAKAKYAAAKLDEEMGIDSEYEEYLNEELVLENKEDAREALLAFKEYVK